LIDEWQKLHGPPRDAHGGGEPERVGQVDVVIGGPVNEEQRTRRAVARGGLAAHVRSDASSQSAPPSGPKNTSMIAS
jgi:hypothetical protein